MSVFSFFREGLDRWYLKGMYRKDLKLIFYNL